MLTGKNSMVSFGNQYISIEQVFVEQARNRGGILKSQSLFDHLAAVGRILGAALVDRCGRVNSSYMIRVSTFFDVS
jgi:hypothetical protein